MGTKVLKSILIIILFSEYLIFSLPKKGYKELYITGIKSFDEKVILSLLENNFKKSKKKIYINEETFLEFSEKIYQFYRSEGFFDVLVDKREGENRYEIEVIEGDKYKISEIIITIEDEDEDKKAIKSDLEKNFILKCGERFRVEDYEKGKSLLEIGFKEKGYPFVSVVEKAEVSFKEKSVKIHYQIKVNTFAFFGEVKIEGIKKSEEPYLRKLITFQKDEPFSISKVDEIRKRFLQSGLFDSVIIKTKNEAENNHVSLKIIVKEGRHKKIRSSIGYGTDEKFRFQFGFESLTLFRKIINYGFNLKKSSLEETFELHLKRSLLKKDITLFLNLRKQHLKWLQTNFDTTLLMVGGEKKFKKMLFSLDGNYEKINNISFDPPLPKIKENAVKPATLFFRFSSSYSDVDSLIDPENGVKGFFSLETYRVRKGITFSKLIVDFRKYFSYKRNVLAFKLKCGSIVTKDSFYGIPYIYRFFTGGQLKLRGYRFNSISPIDDNGSLKGGKSLLESSIELRFPLLSNIKGLLFLESGKVTTNNNPFSDNEPFRSDIGLGIRYISNAGPIGIDVAYGLNRVKYSKNRILFSFFIGYAF